MKKYLIEIEKKLAVFPQRTSAQNPEAYIGGGQSKLRYLGLRTPDLRKAFRDGFSFSKEDAETIAKIWDDIWWNSDCYEVMSLSLMFYEEKKRHELAIAHWPRLKKWSSRIDNWAHSDSLSGIYARIHENNPKEVFTTFKKWNGSSNPWLRRLSIVSLFYYSAQRKTHPPLAKVQELIKPQLGHSDYYVQKGVGWTLREAGNVYPGPVFAFIRDNVDKISPHAYSAATEKMTQKQREDLKQRRKTARKAMRA